MGCAASRRCAQLNEEAAALRIRVSALEEGLRKEKGETAALRKKMAAEERRRRELDNPVLPSGDELQVINACSFVEQMKAENERREMAVEKWKNLYLTIKAELDALILRTGDGEGLWGAEQLRGEMKAKEAAMGELRAQLEAAEAERVKKEREMDILRQSIRILAGKLKKNTRFRRNLRS